METPDNDATWPRPPQPTVHPQPRSGEQSSVMPTTVDPAVPSSAHCGSCLPGTAVFGRWRRREEGQGDVGSAAVAGDDNSDGHNHSTAESEHADICNSAKRPGIGVSRRSWGRSGFSKDMAGGSSKKIEGGESASSKLLTSNAFSIEEAEALAVRDWGGRGSSGGTGSARDVWKELSQAAGTSKTVGVGGGGAGGVSSAVRLRLRFVPLYDCLGVSCTILYLVVGGFGVRTLRQQILAWCHLAFRSTWGVVLFVLGSLVSTVLIGLVLFCKGQEQVCMPNPLRLRPL